MEKKTEGGKRGGKEGLKWKDEEMMDKVMRENKRNPSKKKRLRDQERQQ